MRVVGRDEALAADRAGDVVRAATEYERLLASGDVTVATLITLAGLYWQVTDPGFPRRDGLDHSFWSTAGERYPQLLDHAATAFPTSTEARFWRKYIRWTDLGGPIVTAHECRQLLAEDPAQLAPAMHLFVQSDGREARSEALELLAQARSRGTTLDRYVISVVESVLARS